MVANARMQEGNSSQQYFKDRVKGALIGRLINSFIFGIMNLKNFNNEL